MESLISSESVVVTGEKLRSQLMTQMGSALFSFCTITLFFSTANFLKTI